MYDPDGNGYGMMNGGNGWLVGFAVLTLVLLFIALLAVLANLFLHVSRKPTSADSLDSGSEARRVLDGRLARGEVAPEEYQALRALLDGS